MRARRGLVVIAVTVAMVTGAVAPATGAAPKAAPPEAVSRHMEGLPGPGPELLSASGRVVSEQTQTPIPFSMVGFALPEGVEVEFRTSAAGDEWTAWQPATAKPKEGPDPDSKEAAAARRRRDDKVGADRRLTQPVWVGEAKWIQLRDAGGATPLEPGAVGVELIDSSGLSQGWLERLGERLTTSFVSAPATASGATQRPEVFSRQEWGADPALRGGGPYYADDMKRGIVHHTADPANDYSRAEADDLVRGMYRYHTQYRGWSDIGYNMLIDRYGRVFEGRAGGLTERVIGAHAANYNEGSFGVSMIGNFDSTAPPQDAVDALAKVLAWKMDIHHVDPTGSTDGLPNLIGHRDVGSTGCPGEYLYQKLGGSRERPGLRQRADEMVGDQLVDPEASTNSARLINGGVLEPVEFTTELAPAGDWQFTVTGPDSDVLYRQQGSGEAASVTWDPEGLTKTGDYTYSFQSPGRRPVQEAVTLREPEIKDDGAAPSPAALGRDGGFQEPVTFSAGLWPQATATVRVTDSEGDTVYTGRDSGKRFEATWSETPPSPGQYRWVIEASDGEPATGSVELVPDLFDRIGNAGDPVASVIDLSRAAFPETGSATRAVIARSDVFADSMAGGPLAGEKGPVLLTPPETLDRRVADELDRVLAESATVYVLGGAQALDEDVVAPLRDRWEVERIGGAERTETAARVAGAVTESSTATAMLARAGPDDQAPWADALAGGAYGAESGTPVLLTYSDTLSEATQQALAGFGVEHTVVLGDDTAITDSVTAKVPGPERVAGKARAGTASAIASSLWGRDSGGDGDRFILTSGYQRGAWRLALAAAPLAARTQAPVLLAGADELLPGSAEYLGQLGYADSDRGAGGWVLGPRSRVSDPVATEASRLLQ
jgi:putative cell wall-binding protein